MDFQTKNSNCLALFDFDGTLSYRDTFIDFIRFAVGWRRFIRGFIFLLPKLILFKLGIIQNDRAKEIVITHFFITWNRDTFEKIALKYSCTAISKGLRKDMLRKLNWHKSQKHTVAVVSASLESYLKKWCDLHGVGLIATKIEFKNGKITGRLKTKNCYGAGKVQRLKQCYDLKSYSRIYVYGNGRGDREMLNLAK